MDAKPQKAELEALIARSDAARQLLAGHMETLRHRINLPARISENIRSHRTIWFAGSAAAGLLFSSLFRKKNPTPAPSHATRSRKGILGIALTAAFALAKPALKAWALNELQKRLIPRSRPRH